MLFKTSGPVITAALAIAACAPSASVPKPLQSQAPGLRTDPPASKEQLRAFALANEYRSANGLAMLSWDDRLARAAQSYARRMATEGFFSHESPDGGTPGLRILAAGYPWRSYAENIAKGYATPESVMDGWVGSAGHRANLLGSGYAQLGIGYAVDAEGVAYWVQDFGS